MARGTERPYAEVILSAGVLLWKKQSVEEVFDAVDGAARIPARFAIDWFKLEHIILEEALENADNTRYEEPPFWAMLDDDPPY